MSLARRHLLAVGAALPFAIVASRPAIACSLIGTRKPSSRDIHSDAKARKTIQMFVELANKGESASDHDIERIGSPWLQDGNSSFGDFIRNYLVSDEQRDERPAELFGAELIAHGRYRAIYLVNVSRRAFVKGQDGASCGPYEDGFWDGEDVWLFTFEYNRLSSVRRLPELDSIYKELVA